MIGYKEGQNLKQISQKTKRYETRIYKDAIIENPSASNARATLDVHRELRTSAFGCVPPVGVFVDVSIGPVKLAAAQSCMLRK